MGEKETRKVSGTPECQRERYLFSYQTNHHATLTAGDLINCSHDSVCVCTHDHTRCSYMLDPAVYGCVCVCVCDCVPVTHALSLIVCVCACDTFVFTRSALFYCWTQVSIDFN